MPDGHTVRQLTADDLELMESLLHTFGEVFNELETYTGKRPGSDYMRRLLGSDCFIPMVAVKDHTVVGGLAAYELKKFEQERSEIYVYDLAVSKAHRRQGMATALIRELRKAAAARGAHVIFVQADTRPEDEAATALYTRLGARKSVLHFDIPVESGAHNP